MEVLRLEGSKAYSAFTEHFTLSLDIRSSFGLLILILILFEAPYRYPFAAHVIYVFCCNSALIASFPYLVNNDVFMMSYPSRPQRNHTLCCLIEKGSPRFRTYH
jgi:hypothetical protein